MRDKRIRNYVIWSYAIFWLMVLGICGSASMVFQCSPVVMRILSNVCAWAPTIVLLCGFKYFCPGQTISGFYKKIFGGKISAISLVMAVLVTMSATLVTVFIVSIIQGNSFGSYWELGEYPFWVSILFSITTGPTGEEAGWRGYVRPLLNEKYSFCKSCILQGAIWAFWHTVLWFVDSDYSGWQMIPYIISNIIVMTGLCFLMNQFMKKHDNLIYGIIIHFCFNFLYCFLKVDIWFYVVLSVVYLVIITIVCKIRNYTKDKIYKLN